MPESAVVTRVSPRTRDARLYFIISSFLLLVSGSEASTSLDMQARLNLQVLEVVHVCR